MREDNKKELYIFDGLSKLLNEFGWNIWLGAEIDLMKIVVKN